MHVLDTRRWAVAAAVAAVALALSAVASTVAGAATSLPRAANGKKVTLVAQGLVAPTQFAFNGSQVFVAAGGDGRTKGGVYMIEDGKPVALPGSPPSSFGVAWKDRTLYASAGPKILAWSAWNGKKFLKKRTVVTAPQGTPGFNGLAFGPDGRLYTGVTLAGEAWDHARPNVPFANTFVAITPSTGKIAVVAKGLRQPWMPLFVRGAKGPLAKAPLLTELAGDNADKSKALPADLLVVARQGADFGFPACFRSTPADCAGFAKPWGSFHARTSPMGLAQIGNKIYMAMFGGLSPGKPAIVTTSLAGGAPKRFLTGFSVPVLAVGANGTTLWAADVAGSIYRVET